MKTFLKYFYLFVLILYGLLTIALGIDECYKCNSGETPDCVKRPENIKSFEPCNFNITDCYTKIDTRGATYRGCAPLDKDCQEHKLCTRCKSAKCNNKIYPAARPKCWHCTQNDKNCNDEPINVELLPCVKYTETAECYTFVGDNEEVSRGCSKDDNIKCDGIKCEICDTDTNGCNNKIVRRCVNCSSKNEYTACIRPENYTVESCSINRKTPKCTDFIEPDNPGRCYTYYKKDLVERGCDKPKEDIPKEGIKLISCMENNCNTKCETDVKCIQCDQSDEKCNAQDNSLFPEPEDCPSYTTFCQSCRHTDTNQVIRQCGNMNISESEWDCYSCYTDGCNNEVFPILCYSCNSSDIQNCGSWDYNDIPYLKFCPNEDKCFAKIDEEGVTIRGCLSEQPELECQEDDPKCNICMESKCNGGIFPKNRLICYQCDESNEDCNLVEQSSMLSSACGNYKIDDACYMTGNETAMNRGCMSDDDENSIACTGEKCIKCSSNNCNSSPYQMNSKMKCIICQNTNEACDWGFKVENAVSCNYMVLYFEKEGCFTYKHDNKSVTRGCSYGSKLCSLNDENCEICSTIGCNSKSTKSNECIRCRSDKPEEETCADRAQGITPSPCVNPSQAFNDRGCYTLTYSGHVMRGCLIDLDEKDLANCWDPQFLTCDICFNSTDCNNEIAPDSAHILQSIPFYTLIILYLLNNVYVI